MADMLGLAQPTLQEIIAPAVLGRAGVPVGPPVPTFSMPPSDLPLEVLAPRVAAPPPVAALPVATPEPVAAPLPRRAPARVVAPSIPPPPPLPDREPFVRPQTARLTFPDVAQNLAAEIMLGTQGMSPFSD
jgi:hypothetical protein